MQGDFTDQPEQIPELVKRFEGGADIVVGEPAVDQTFPKPVRQLQRVGRWIASRFAKVPGVNNPLGSFRLFRVTVVRDAVRAAGDKPMIEGEAWGANVDLLLAMAPHARRIESVPLQPRYDLRPRSTRSQAVARCASPVPVRARRKGAAAAAPTRGAVVRHMMIPLVLTLLLGQSLPALPRTTRRRPHRQPP
jgi:hypothetical protein